jgi:hypothetical protein
MVVHLSPPIKMGGFAEAPNVTDLCSLCPCACFTAPAINIIAHLTQFKVDLSDIFNLASDISA